MLSAASLRLRISPAHWYHGIDFEYNNEDDTRKMSRRVNANGLANAGTNVTFNDGKDPPKSASSFRCDLSFHGGGELPIEPNDHAPKRHYGSREPMRKHCGWVEPWEDEGKIALSVQLHVPDDIFSELYDRLKLGFYLPTEVAVIASAATFNTKMGPFAEWNITGKIYLYIAEFSISYAPVKMATP